MKKNYIRRILDSIPQLDMFRADVETGIFAQQLVTVTLSELFRHEFPETKWMNGGLIPISTNVSEGAKEYSFIESIRSGRAAIVADNATDLPAAEVTGRNNLRPIKTVGVYVTYSTQDIRSARLQGIFDIATEKAGAAREANDRTLDDLIRTGDAETGLRGVVNAPGIIVQNAVTGTWATATAAQIVADVTTAINAVISGSENIEVPDTVLLDVANWLIVSTTPRGPGDNTLTVLDFLKKAHPMITRWDWEPGLNIVSASSGPSMLVYRRAATRLRAIFPMMMRALPPEQKGLSFKLNFETRFGGVMIPKPRSILRLDGL